MSELIPELDHVVINVGAGLNEAAARYRRLGFQLSERGHHSLGSSNHLAIFKRNYLELLGYETDRGHLRKALWQSPPGLSGLVWKTEDADAVYRHLQQRELAGDPAASFFRPVTLPDGSQQEARFHTVALQAEKVPNGRSFFCQHLTPEAVWQPAWQQHPNGVTQISEFVIASGDPAAAAAVYGQLFGTQRVNELADGERQIVAGDAVVRFLSSEQATAEWGPLAADYDGSPRMIALQFDTRSLAQVRESLTQGEIPFSEDQRGVRVSSEFGWQLALRFSPG